MRYTHSVIILSIDSGIEKTGYAIFEKDPKNSQKITYKTSGLIKTSSKKTTAQRLLEIHSSIKCLIEEWKPDVVVLEQLFFFKNQKTVIVVAQAQGVVQLLAAQHKIPLETLTPLQIKQIVTGYGTSDKKSVEKMIRITLPHIQLAQKRDDEIDAIACALAYCYLNKNLIQ